MNKFLEKQNSSKFSEESEGNNALSVLNIDSIFHNYP
jgi:hypothetical protein